MVQMLLAEGMLLCSLFWAFCWLGTGSDEKNIRNFSTYVDEPKTKKGARQIPMSEKVYQALKRAVKNRGKAAPVNSGGYTNFLFLNQSGLPKTASCYESMFQGLVRKYNKHHKPDEALPNITPHTMRHTFCTRLAQAGMNPKDLQYNMGHSNITMTLNYYAHADYASAKAAMDKLAA